jgi:peroxiredoxin
MKKILFIATLGVLMASLLPSCKNDSQSAKMANQLTGELRGVTDATVFVKSRGEKGWETIDSAVVTGGKFQMMRLGGETKLVYLVSDAFRGGIPIFLENAEVRVSMHKDSLKMAVITGGPIQQAYKDVEDKMGEFDKSWQEYYHNTFKMLTDDEKMQNEAHMNQLYEQAQQGKKDFLKDFISKHKDNIACAQILLDQEEAVGTDDMLILFDQLTPEVKASAQGAELGKRVEIIKKTAVGMPAIDFAMSDTTGQMQNLLALAKGKYVLVDFWAAWCSPCRAENPNVLNNYNTYHSLGFDVIGISFDETREDWIKAIHNDQLIWAQLSDLKGWNNEAGKLYGIRSIPQNILLNPEGIILAKNLRGDDLRAKLKEIFGK